MPASFHAGFLLHSLLSGLFSIPTVARLVSIRKRPNPDRRGCSPLPFASLGTSWQSSDAVITTSVLEKVSASANPSAVYA